MEDHRGWHSRGYLPHLDIGEVTQFITFRLGDSLPQSVLEELEDLRRRGEHVARIERAEYYFDQGHGSCILREPSCAMIVQEALIFLHDKRFELIAWVIIPNHVHFLARFGEGQSLSKGMHSLKSYTSNELGKLHPEVRPIWQQESFDRYIRGEEHYQWVVNYIHNNPVIANYCESSDDFPWSSAYRER